MLLVNTRYNREGEVEHISCGFSLGSRLPLQACVERRVARQARRAGGGVWDRHTTVLTSHMCRVGAVLSILAAASCDDNAVNKPGCTAPATNQRIYICATSCT